MQGAVGGEETSGVWDLRAVVDVGEGLESERRRGSEGEGSERGWERSEEVLADGWSVAGSVVNEDLA